MDKNKIVMIAPVAVAVILMLVILAAISSTNQAFAAATTATTLTLQVQQSTKTLGKASDMVPLTISGKLWTKDFSHFSGNTWSYYKCMCKWERMQYF